MCLQYYLCERITVAKSVKSGLL